MNTNPVRISGYSRMLVLIDGDQMPPSHWPSIQATISKLGTVHRVIVAHNERRQEWTRIADVECEVMPYVVKDGVDFYLTMRFGELLAEQPDAVAVVSNDSDFAALLLASRKMRGLPAFSLTSAVLPVCGRFAMLAEAADLCIVYPILSTQGESEAEDAASPGTGRMPPEVALLKAVLLELDADTQPVSVDVLHKSVENLGIHWKRQKICQHLHELEGLFQLDEDKKQVRLLDHATPHLAPVPQEAEAK